MEQQFHQGQALLQHIHSNLGRLEQTLSEAEAQPYFKEISSQTRWVEPLAGLEFAVSWPRSAPSWTGASAKRALRSDGPGSSAWTNSSTTSSALVPRSTRCSSGSRTSSAPCTNATNSSPNGIALRSVSYFFRIRPAETAVHLEDQELLYNDRLKGAHRGVDDLLGNAENVLAALKSQHWNLKGIRRTLTGFGQTLGLSQTTLSLIERRVSEDKLVFCVGAVFVLLFMYAFYSFWTR